MIPKIGHPSSFFGGLEKPINFLFSQLQKKQKDIPFCRQMHATALVGVYLIKRSDPLSQR